MQRVNFLLPIAASLAMCAPVAGAVTVGDATQLILAGKYEECVDLAAAEIARGVQFEPWRHVKAEAELTLGRYADALDTVEEGMAAYPRSLRMRLWAREAYLFNNRTEAAEDQSRQMAEIVRLHPRQLSSPPERLALGEFLLLEGVDARQVLEYCFDPVTKSLPEFADGHFAAAQLAIDKYDNRLASETLLAAPESVRSSPKYHYLLARAFAADDPERAADALDAALAINPRHVDSLLMLTENLIDGEQYEDADKMLQRVLAINPQQPRALAYAAVLAHLAGDAQRAAQFRTTALGSWADNPEVDYTIGAKLSDKYRFAEGAAHQRRALAMDRDYVPARIQLAQDLLRLGQEQEGWQLVHDVAAVDGYNVVAHNLSTLHDAIDDYRVLQNEDFRLRMVRHEAAVYGDRVLELLAEARDALCEKYDVELRDPVVVDIYTSKNDFAVRTFGIPGADGFLGVCFGNVITANSPAALGETRANWEAVLWHEFCHVVTLHKSKNKMPRWLSEGISVYEELQRDRAWGQQMTPAYREMILGGEMARLSELSSMFLAPKSPLHLQFAYFESACAVQFLVDKRGLEAVKAILDDLADDVSINEALIRHAGPLEDLDRDFRDAMLRQAGELGSDLDWTKPPESTADRPAELTEWVNENPDNFYSLVNQAQAMARAGDWHGVLEPAQRLRDEYPEFVGNDGPYSLLARAYRELGQSEKERETLEAWSQRDGEAMDAYLRLIELARAENEWPAVYANAKRILAVDPLTPAPHRYLSEAAEQLDKPHDAIAAYQALLEFDTVDRVDAHYRLARLFDEQASADRARRHLLLALEEAPRFLAAHRLLLKLTEAGSTDGDQRAPDDGRPDASPTAPETDDTQATTTP